MTIGRARAVEQLVTNDLLQPVDDGLACNHAFGQVARRGECLVLYGLFTHCCMTSVWEMVGCAGYCKNELIIVSASCVQAVCANNFGSRALLAGGS